MGQGNSAHDPPPKFKPSLKPLYLSPLIADNRPDEARHLSRVDELPMDSSDDIIESYSGLITVNEKFNSNLFYWFFPGPQTDAPLIVWMEGGPGHTSLFSLFNANGPYVVLPNGTLAQRDFTWSNFSHVLYLDFPVGTGYSYIQDPKGLSTTISSAVDDLLNFLDQFFWMFPEYQSNDVYFGGGTYATKYAIMGAYKLLHQSDIDINLKGILLTNPLLQPSLQTDYYADYFYQNGLINIDEYRHFRAQQDKIKSHVRKHEYLAAFQTFDELILGRFTKDKSYFKTVTGYSSHNNLLDITYPRGFDYYLSYVVKADVRKAIHVGDLPFNAKSDDVARALIPEYFQSLDHELPRVFDNFRVLFMNGNLDIIIPIASVGHAVDTVKWKCRQKMKKAEKEIGVWSIEERDIIGHLTTACDVYNIIVRNAGSNLVYDQQEIAYTLVEMFTNVSLPFEF